MRSDIRAVFFIHDLLPLQFPEYFEPKHVAWHRRSLEIFAQYGRAAIVNSHVVEHQVLDFLRSHHRHGAPVLTLPMPPPIRCLALLRRPISISPTYPIS